MALLSMVRLAMQGLLERKSRTMLTVLGIFIATALITSLVSMSQGQAQSVSDQLTKLGPTTIVLRERGADASFTQQDIADIQRYDGVAKAIPTVIGTGLVKRGGDEEVATIIGVDPLTLEEVLPGFEVRDGRMIGPAEMTRAVVGSKLGEPGASRPPLAQTDGVVQIVLTLAPADGDGRPQVVTRNLAVAGVAEPFGATFLFDVDTAVIVTLRAAQGLFDVNGYNQIIVLASSTDDVEPVTRALNDEYGEDYFVIAVTTIAELVSAILGGLTALVLFIAGVSLVVAGVGIANTMLVSVMERTREIGVMRAIGFRARDVRRIFIIEAGITGFVGGLLGTGMGVLISLALSWAVATFAGGSGFQDPEGTGFAGPGGEQRATGPAFELAPVVSPELIIGVILFAVAVATLAGFLPARKAARLDPVQALSST